jgi:hypothetical protein
LAGTFITRELGYNNPSELALSEASLIIDSYQSQRWCLVSIGGGRERSVTFREPATWTGLSWFNGISNLVSEKWKHQRKLAEGCVRLLRDTEAVHQRLARKSNSESNNFRYYRFNVERGLDDIGFYDWNECDTLEGRTRAYLSEQSTWENIKNCISDLLDMQKLD